MVTKERKEHGEDISNQYVSRISPEHTEIMDEIKRLPIQDIITIYSNAEWAFEKGLYHGISKDALEQGAPDAKRFYDAIAYVKEIIIERLKTADVLWTVTDKITNSPFIDDLDTVWIFTEKELADECVDYFMQQYRTSFMTETIQGNMVDFFGRTVHMKGAKKFLADLGAYAEIEFKGEEIIPKPDFSEVDPAKRPVMNPDFFRAVAKLHEERYYRANYEGKGEKLRRFEDDMIKAFHDAKFLVPVKGMEEVANGNGGTISIPYLSKVDGDNKINLTPVFTDWNEFYKIYPQEKGFGGWVWSPQDLLSSSDDIIVVNAASLRFEMSKKMIQQMLDIYENELK